MASELGALLTQHRRDRDRRLMNITGLQIDERTRVEEDFRMRAVCDYREAGCFQARKKHAAADGNCDRSLERNGGSFPDGHSPKHPLPHRVAKGPDALRLKQGKLLHIKNRKDKRNY